MPNRVQMAEKIMTALRLIDGPTIINGFYQSGIVLNKAERLP